MASSRARMALRNCPTLGQDTQPFLFPHCSLMVCMTLVKVAVCSRGNPEMGGELTETPAIRPIGPLMRGAYQRHIRMSAIMIVQKPTVVLGTLLPNCTFMTNLVLFFFSLSPNSPVLLFLLIFPHFLTR